MVIRLLTLFGLLGTAFGLTFVRYRGRRQDDERNYGEWLGESIGAAFSASPASKARAVLSAWTSAHYPVWTKWVFFGFLASFAFQALTGIVFEIFISRGLFGLPLIGHMLGGGLFGVSLAALLLWRGRSYRLDENIPDFFDDHLRPSPKAMSPSYGRKLIFWAFATFGFVQVATAVGSMLPVFSFATQVALLNIHRLSALGLVIAAALFAEKVFVPPRRP
jgi:hypothetical protein